MTGALNFIETGLGMHIVLFAKQFFGMFLRKCQQNWLSRKPLWRKEFYPGQQQFETKQFRAFFMHRTHVVLSV